MYHRLDTNERGQRVHGEIVWGRTEATRGQHYVCLALHSPREGFHNGVEVVREHRDTTHQGTKAHQLLGHPKGIGILNTAHD